MTSGRKRRRTVHGNVTQVRLENAIMFVTKDTSKAVYLALLNNHRV